jgi:hypothetical protein
MKGWCPVHDRVFDAPGKTCPDCGTALVSLAEKKRGARSLVVIDEKAEDAGSEPVHLDAEAPAPIPSSEEPVQIGVAAIAAAASIVVIGAFFLGVAITRGNRTHTPPAGAPKAREDYQVGVVQAGAGVTLRLDSFAQRGRDIVARVTVPPQSGIEIGKISSVVVVPLTARSEGVGTARLAVRTTTTGFIATGRVVRDAGIPVTGLEIVALTQDTSPFGDLLPVDLSRIWPVAVGGSPKATAARGTVRYSDARTFTLTGLVGWPDRIEAGLTVKGDRAGWVYDEAFSLVFESEGPGVGTLVDSPTILGLRQVAFRGIPRSVSKGAIQILVHGVTIQGNWRWMFT